MSLWTRSQAAAAGVAATADAGRPGRSAGRAHGRPRRRRGTGERPGPGVGRTIRPPGSRGRGLCRSGVAARRVRAPGGPGRAAARRVRADGGCAPGRRVAHQRGSPADRTRRAAGQHPPLRATPAVAGRPSRARHRRPTGRRPACPGRRRAAQRRHLRRDVVGEDRDARGPGRPDRRARAHRHRGGCGRAAHRPPARRAPRRPAAEPRGPWRRPDPRAGPKRPADAARPAGRGRGPGTRGAGHAPGHGYRPRRVAEHRPRDRPGRRPAAAGDAGPHERGRAPALRRPRAGGRDHRPGRPSAP